MCSKDHNSNPKVPLRDRLTVGAVFRRYKLCNSRRALLKNSETNVSATVVLSRGCDPQTPAVLNHEQPQNGNRDVAMSHVFHELSHGVYGGSRE